MMKRIEIHPSNSKLKSMKNAFVRLAGCHKFLQNICKLQSLDCTLVWLAERRDLGAALPKIAPTGFDFEGP